jgi:hypothetical protein
MRGDHSKPRLERVVVAGEDRGAASLWYDLPISIVYGGDIAAMIPTSKIYLGAGSGLLF